MTVTEPPRRKRQNRVTRVAIIFLFSSLVSKEKVRAAGVFRGAEVAAERARCLGTPLRMRHRWTRTETAHPTLLSAAAQRGWFARNGRRAQWTRAGAKRATARAA